MNATFLIYNFTWSSLTYSTKLLVFIDSLLVAKERPGNFLLPRQSSIRWELLTFTILLLKQLVAAASEVSGGAAEGAAALVAAEGDRG